MQRLRDFDKKISLVSLDGWRLTVSYKTRGQVIAPKRNRGANVDAESETRSTGPDIGTKQNRNGSGEFVWNEEFEELCAGGGDSDVGSAFPSIGFGKSMDIWCWGV